MIEHSPNIVRVTKIRRLSWAGHESAMEESRSAFNILTDKSTGRSPLKNLNSRWEDNIRLCVKLIGANTRIVLVRLRIGIIEDPL